MNYNKRVNYKVEKTQFENTNIREKGFHFYTFWRVGTVRRRGDHLAGCARRSAAAGFRVGALNYSPGDPVDFLALFSGVRPRGMEKTDES